MKTKLEMAHEYAVAMLRAGVTKESATEFAQTAFILVDAMQAEADKRDKGVATQKRRALIIKRSEKVKRVIREAERNGLVDDHSKQQTFINDIEQERIYSSDWQPDWSVVPAGYDWFVVGGCSGKGFFCLVKPSIVKDHYWFVGEDSISVEKHSYVGDWRGSLRKRPQ